MKKTLLLSIFGVLVILSGLAYVLLRPGAANAPAQAHSVAAIATLEPERRQDVEEIRRALAHAVQGRQDVIAFLMYGVEIDHVEFNESGNLALVWTSLVDLESGEVIPAEAGLAIARRVQDGKGGLPGWKISLQADASFAEALEKVPVELLPDDLRERYRPGQQKEKKAHQVFGGYRLPWEAGLAKRVSGSIGHVFVYKTCPTTCLYAFDFADGTMFPVHAARGGRVKYAVWKYPNGNTKHANYLILEDTSTNPTTYQVYYHLAQDSIPEKFRRAGAEVLQGERIGLADDTGPSTGHHLHFMVHATASSYWGTSVDITFDDVKDNGGRPRTCAEAAQFPGYGRECQAKNLYISGNGDVERPTGQITSPKAGSEIAKRKLKVTAKGKDDTGVASMRLFISYNGEWKAASKVVEGGSLSATLDLCALDIPDGPFSLGLVVKDRSGKVSDGYSGETQFIKKAACSQAATPTPTPMPDCRPGEQQVAIFAGAIYSGACQVLDIGEYPDWSAFSPVGNDDIESVKLGEKATVWLYSNGSFGGKEERLAASDVDLGDNVIGRNTVSSLKVQGLIPAPDAPQLQPPVSAETGEAPTDQDRLELAWRPAEHAEESRSELLGQENFRRELDWQTGTTWNVGKLPPGRYQWTVWTRNISGESHASLEFSVKEFDFPPESHMEALPGSLKTSAILLQWVLDKGEGDVNAFEVQYRQDGEEWKSWAVALPGWQRQAWFLGKLGSAYEFRMRAIDRQGNAEEYPAEAEAQVQLEPGCQPDLFELLGDDHWGSPTPLEIGEEQVHNFCGPGDEDWLVFLGEANQTYQFKAQSLGGAAAAVLRVYDSQDLWLLADRKPADFGEDTTLEWTAPADGIYLLRVTPLEPRLCGEDVRYTIWIERVGRIHPTGVALSSLVLPLLWFLVKWYLRRKTAGDGALL